MTIPVPITITRPPPITWAEVRRQILSASVIVLHLAGIGAGIGGVVGGVVVATGRANVVEWFETALMGSVAGAILGMLLWGRVAWVRWRNAQGQRLDVRPAPFQQAAWDVFVRWAAADGPMEAHKAGCAQPTLTITWNVSDGAIRATHGPRVEVKGVTKRVDTTFLDALAPARIDPQAAVDPHRVRAFMGQTHGVVQARIGPLSVGTPADRARLAAVARS